MKLFSLVVLLAVAAGCTKRQEPAPATPAAGTASYQHDGQLVTCRAEGILLPSLTGILLYEILNLKLTTTPQPSAGPEVLYVNFYRQPGGTATSFFLQSCTQVQNGTYTTYERGAYSLATTASGGYSGTFAGTVAAPGTSTISQGIFTDVRL